MQGEFCKSLWLRCAVAMLLIVWLAGSAFAADGQTSVYCFGGSEFQDEEMTGIFVLSVPDAEIGKICYGERQIRSGDVLTREVMNALTLKTACATDAQAVMTYLPVYGSRLGEDTSLTIHIRSGKAGVPIAKGLKLETYKNIPNDGVLQATDEGGGEMTFAVVDAPKLGKVEISEGGKFVYTPDKNKVGEDSFTYTATDSDGNTSEPATVKIEILKPVDQTSYSDMVDSDDAFEAAWLREKGLYSGSVVGGQYCFHPEAEVSRGEFLVMAMKLMDIAADDSDLSSGFGDEADAPIWMRPYLTSAMRRGYVRGFSSPDGLVFRPNSPVTYATASVMLQNMMKLTYSGAKEVSATNTEAPVWAQEAVATLRQNNLPIPMKSCTEPMTHTDTARLLYAISQMQ